MNKGIIVVASTFLILICVCGCGKGKVTYYQDKDHDKWGDKEHSVTIPGNEPIPAGYVEKNGDCDDSKPAINPDAEAVPGNAVDENCSADIDGKKKISPFPVFFLIGLILIFIFYQVMLPIYATVKKLFRANNGMIKD